MLRADALVCVSSLVAGRDGRVGGRGARVVARRAERHAWVAVREFPETTSVWPAKYLNRLSDLLFILSRVANAGDDVLWVPGGERGPDTIGGSSPDANDDAAAGDAAADATDAGAAASDADAATDADAAADASGK